MARRVAGSGNAAPHECVRTRALVPRWNLRRCEVVLEPNRNPSNMLFVLSGSKGAIALLQVL
jgi:hypothetical protein